MNFDLFLDIDRFCKAKGISPAQFSRRAMNDANFIGELKRGRIPKPETVARIRAFMEAA